MEVDLLFAAINDADWKEITANDNFEPETFKEHGYVQCFEGSDAENIINEQFEDISTVLLLVIDPLRIQSPIKSEKEGDYRYIKIMGTFSVDAIIDKIKLRKDKKGRFSVNVKHYD